MLFSLLVTKTTILQYSDEVWKGMAARQKGTTGQKGTVILFECSSSRTENTRASLSGWMGDAQDVFAGVDSQFAIDVMDMCSNGVW